MRVICWCCQSCIESDLFNKSFKRVVHETDGSDTDGHMMIGAQISEGAKRSDTTDIILCRKSDDKCSSSSCAADKSSTSSRCASQVNDDSKMSSDAAAEDGVFYEAPVAPSMSMEDFFDEDFDPMEHILQCLGYHTNYMECFINTHKYLLHGNGPLPYDHRHYIGIMASSRHYCSYLVHMETTEFLSLGGNKDWLLGLNNVPNKLRNLSEINKITAHRPWLLSAKHIEKLTKDQDNWSISELTHAIVLLSHFHSLASFVSGCGITLFEEVTTEFRNRCGSTSSGSISDADNISASEVGIESLIERMMMMSSGQRDEFSPEELLSRFEFIESQSAELPMRRLSTRRDLLCFVDEPNYRYQDFAKRGLEASDIQAFQFQDYSWEDHGYSLASRLYVDVGNLLDDRFRTSQSQTYETFGNVDSSLFRRAVWNYIQCLFGMRHDDYDYSLVNHLLGKNLRSYIKTVACMPETASQRSYNSFMQDFLPCEKIHINIMIMEARMQAELLYSLRAIARYMT